MYRDIACGVLKLSKYKLSLICLFLLSLFVCFYNLNQSIAPGDESIHWRVIQEMQQKKSLLPPTHYDVIYFNKPPLKMLASIVLVKIFGDENRSYRLIDAASGCIVLILTFYLAYTCFSSLLISWISALTLLSSKIFLFDHGVRYGGQDSALLLLSTLSLVILLPYCTDRVRIPKLVSIFIGTLVGLALLVKWIAGLFPLIILIFWGSITTQNRNWLKKNVSSLSIISFIAFIIPALYVIPSLILYRDEFINSFKFNITQRLITEGIHNKNNLFFYFRDILFSNPLSSPIILVIGVSSAIWIYFKEKSDLILFLLIWGIAPIVLYSLAKSRLPWYILPVYPALSIIIAFGIKEFIFKIKSYHLPIKLLSVCLVAIGFIQVAFGISNNLNEIITEKKHTKVDLITQKLTEYLKTNNKTIVFKNFVPNQFPESKISRREGFYLNKLTPFKTNSIVASSHFIVTMDRNIIDSICNFEILLVGSEKKGSLKVYLYGLTPEACSLFGAKDK